MFTLKDFLAYTLVVVIMLALIVGLSVFALVVIEQPACTLVTKDIGYPSKWGMLEGCMIEVEKGKWIPVKNYRYFEETK